MRLCAAAIAPALMLISCSGTGGGPRPNDPGSQHKVTIIATTELRGQIEPCGCNSDPLGDMARWVEVVAAARRGGDAVLYIDGGSLLYTQTELSAGSRVQETLKAKLIAEVVGQELAPAAVGLGPYDLAAGPAGVALPRMAENLGGSGIALAPRRVVEAGGVKVGLFGVVSPAAVAGAKLSASDPVAAARTAIAALRGDGAEVIVALAHMPEGEARLLARGAPGIDFLVVGQGAPDPSLPPGPGNHLRDAPEQVGGTWLIAPAQKGEVIARVDVTVRPGGKGFADAIGAYRAKSESAALGAQIDELTAQLAKWKADPTADPAFLATKRTELADLATRRAELDKDPVHRPAEGSWFTLSQIRIEKALPCDAGLVARKQAFDQALGKANLDAAGDHKPPAPAKGQAGYVGAAECASCHQREVEFWKTTKHSHAWEALTQVGKQLDLDCVRCHVTGWDEPGGTNLAFNEGLRDIQCEVCHGPASLHVDSDGKSKLGGAPPAERCKQCHSPEHSDTFAYEAYLRDVTGTGHGEALHAKLGSGPTGHELRAAALARAGAALGKACPK